MSYGATPPSYTGTKTVMKPKTSPPDRVRETPNPVGRPRQIVKKDDPRYQPTPAELEEDVRVDASPEELAQALFGRHPRRIVH